MGSYLEEALKKGRQRPGTPSEGHSKDLQIEGFETRSSLLWGAGERASGVWGTDAISRALADAAKALGFKQRVSAHSGRKGAAIEALFAGAPLPVIQAFGGWKSVDTLQSRLAEGVRRSSSVFQVVLGDRREDK